MATFSDIATGFSVVAWMLWPRHHLAIVFKRRVFSISDPSIPTQNILKPTRASCAQIEASEITMKTRTFTHKAEYETGEAILRELQWTPVPDEMLKLPSVAKGTDLRKLCDSASAKLGNPVEDIIESVHLAASMDHLIAIGGEAAREHLLSHNCIISADHIANLCRRMPPFIAVKLKHLETGSFTSDSNPTGAFDTNGWGELRTRLPKFRSSLQHYARQVPVKDVVDVEKLRAILSSIEAKCDALLAFIGKFTPVGAGKPRAAKPATVRTMEWAKAVIKFSQALGVLRKTNRDMTSEHWKAEWIPTVAEFEIVQSDVESMRDAARSIAEGLNAT